MEFKLILKKLNKTLTPEEEIIFQNWYNESRFHKEYFDHVSMHFNDDPLNVDVKKGWNLIEKRINKTKTQIRFWKYAVAASILLILGVSVFYSLTDKQNNHSKVVHTNVNGGTDKAILTLENGSNVILEKGKTFRSGKLSSDGESLIYHDEKTVSGKIAYNYLTIPRGGQFLLKLTDGTKIWLNSDSKIKYPKNFIDGKTRNVELVYGEAYFEVSPSTNHKGSKFRVITKGQQIEVLGTEFNVKAYSDEENTYTTLVNGKVTVSNAYFKKFLKPSQQSVISKHRNEIKIVSVDIYDVTSWRRGVFSFKDTSLFEITKVLSRWYDVQFIYENNDLKNIRYTGVLDKNHSVETILSILKTTNNINYEIKNRTIVLK